MLSSQLHDRNNQLQTLRMNEANSQYTIFNTQEKLVQAQRELERLRKENHDLKMRNDNLHVERTSEATAYLEVEHLKKDNQRLLNLLKNTQ